MTDKQALGQIAEKLACKFLKSKGLKLVQENYTCHHGEIDLIMKDQDDIVFVEVRCRSSVDFGTASDSITKFKIMKLIKTAKFFLQFHRCMYSLTSRFDIVAIHRQGEMYEIDWIKNAFLVDL